MILGKGGRASRESLIELEKAADSARYAAEADLGATEATRNIIVDTHDWVCTYKVTSAVWRLIVERRASVETAGLPWWSVPQGA